MRAAGACLRYAQETQRAAAAHVTDIHYFEPQDQLILDQTTVRNLEFIEAQGVGSRAHTLLEVIDETVSGMGARFLRSWLLRPSCAGARLKRDTAGRRTSQLAHQARQIASALERSCRSGAPDGSPQHDSASPRDVNAHDALS